MEEPRRQAEQPSSMDQKKRLERILARTYTRRNRLNGWALLLVIGLFTLTKLQPFSASVKWSFPTETPSRKVAFSPLVVNDIVYLSTHDGELDALDAASGNKKWSFRGEHRGVIISPTVANGIVYINSDDGTLYALDAVSGSIKWSFQIMPFPFGFSSTPPTVVNGMVYMSSRDGYLTALDALSGKEKWSFRKGIFNPLSSPSVSNGMIYIKVYPDISSQTDGTLYALDARSGTEKWFYTTRIQHSTNNFLPPVVINNIVYDEIGEITTGVDEVTIQALDARSGTEKWSYATGGRLDWSPPIVADGVLSFAVDFPGGSAFEPHPEDSQYSLYGLYALDALSGTKKWFLPTANSVFLFPVVSNGVIYFTVNSDLYALDVHSGAKIWSHGGISSFPAVVNGIVYITLDVDGLSALDGRSGRKLWSISQRSIFPPTVANSIIYLIADSALFAIQAPVFSPFP